MCEGYHLPISVLCCKAATSLQALDGFTQFDNLSSKPSAHNPISPTSGKGSSKKGDLCMV